MYLLYTTSFAGHIGRGEKFQVITELATDILQPGGL